MRHWVQLLSPPSLLFAREPHFGAAQVAKPGCQPVRAQYSTQDSSSGFATAQEGMSQKAQNGLNGQRLENGAMRRRLAGFQENSHDRNRHCSA